MRGNPHYRRIILILLLSLGVVAIFSALGMGFYFGFVYKKNPQGNHPSSVENPNSSSDKIRGIKPYKVSPDIVKVKGLVVDVETVKWIDCDGPGMATSSLFVDYPEQKCTPMPSDQCHADTITPFEHPYCAVRHFINLESYPRMSRALPDGIDLETLRDRYRGALLGLMIGDALGECCEGEPPAKAGEIMSRWPTGRFPPNRRKFCVPGDFTDDGSQALCMAKSLIDNRAMDGRDLFNTYLAWRRHGLMTSTPSYFGIGTGTSAVLDKGALNVRADCDDAHRPQWGNGCLMRLAPVPLFFGLLPDELLTADAAAASALSSHTHHSCRGGCRYMAQLMWHFLRRPPVLPSSSTHSLDINEYKRNILLSIRNLWPKDKLMPEIARLYEHPEKAQVVDNFGYSVSAHGGLNYVVKVLMDSNGNFEDGLRAVIALGQDADTTAAILGMLLGTLYGLSGIPKWMVDQVYGGPVALELADLLLKLALDPDATLDPSSVLVPDQTGNHLQVIDVNPTRLSKDLRYITPLEDIEARKQAQIDSYNKSSH